MILFKASIKWVLAKQVFNSSKFTSILKLQRDHLKMKNFRILCIVGLVCNVLELFSLVYLFDGSDNTNKLPQDLRENRFELFWSSVVSVVVEIYFFICVDSLVKKVKENQLPHTQSVNYQQSPYNPQFQVPLHVTSISNYPACQQMQPFNSQQTLSAKPTQLQQQHINHQFTNAVRDALPSDHKHWRNVTKQNNLIW